MTESQPPELDEQRRVGGYRLVRKLGGGGQGVVYLGRSPSGADVAVKVLHAWTAADPAVRRRFLREVEAASRVAPFATARVLDMGDHEGRPYIVSEYVPGGSLDQVVKADGPRTGGGLERLAVATISALAAIHRAGIVHRDFKPGNVILGPEGPVVIDFGISRALDQSGTATRAIGTPPYMAPELFAEESPGFAADIFSWGCTMVFAASGHRPFPGETVPVVVNAILSGEPDLSGVPDMLLPLLARCLAKNPADRPTAPEVLRTLTGEEPAPQAPARNPEPPRRRRGIVLAGAAVVALAVAAALAVPPLLRQGDPEPFPRTTTTPVSESIPFGEPLFSPLTDHGNDVRAIALAQVGPTPVAVTGGDDRTVRVLDLGARRQAGDALTTHTGWVRSIATGELDGAPIALTGSDDDTVRVWNLAERTEIGAPFTGHTADVKAVAVGVVNGRTVAVSGGADRTVRVWDPATGVPLYAPMTGHDDTVWSIAYGEVDGRPVAVSASDDGTLRLWDLTTGRQSGPPVKTTSGQVRAVAFGRIDGTPVAVSGGADGALTLWDLTRKTPSGAPLTGHQGPVWSVAFGEVNGVPIAVSGGEDRTVRVWNLRTRTPVGSPFTGHTDRVWTVAIGRLAGSPIVLSGGRDETVRPWSLATPFPP
ncbi:serine/threonine-protein kinase [Spongiactinospora sp. TRM90649]|uniref:serine/threonine-protein kinase n=1 Tax=Spongiactinospora sp. TRM90649 TaxID=3031114 RepID=UPI0023F75291|nr:serine/threonine-protein kinase [Spongiactinospora sp. TRM90649]MDF5754543.1 serine/threonine protein kinase [Spongiactinospora sp. TRM90649]